MRFTLTFFAFFGIILAFVAASAIPVAEPEVKALRNDFYPPTIQCGDDKWCVTYCRVSWNMYGGYCKNGFCRCFK